MAELSLLYEDNEPWKMVTEEQGRLEGCYNDQETTEGNTGYNTSNTFASQTCFAGAILRNETRFEILYELSAGR